MRAIVAALFVVLWILWLGGTAHAQPGPAPAPPPYPYPYNQPAPPPPPPAPVADPDPATTQPYPAQPYPPQPYPPQPYPAPQPYPTPYPPSYPYPYPPVQLTEDEQELLAMGEIPENRYLAGAALSLFFGLGVGHAVQGRYGEIGKIFTIGEIGTVTAALVGALRTIDDRDHADGQILLVGGLVGFVALRVWEIVDAFTEPPSHNAKVRALKLRLGMPMYARLRPYVAPPLSHNGTATAGVTFRF